MKQKYATSIFLVFIFSYISLFACDINLSKKTDKAFLESKIQAEYVSTSQNQVDKIISTARSLIGSRQYNGYCQRFVRICYESAGIYAKESAMTALEAWGMWKVSTRSDNIPIGAVIYFQGYGYDWNYGHSAIYIGNGCVIDATNYGVTERKITNWQGYLGWGYQAGIAPKGSQPPISKENPPMSNQTPAPKEEPPKANPSRLLGDCDNDGKITAGDSRLCLQAASRLINVSKGDLPYYDANKDGNITAEDARIILRASARLISLN